MTTAIEQVRVSLRRAVDKTMFDTGHTVTVRPGFSSTTYMGRCEEILSPERVREIHNQAKWDDDELRRARSAIVVMPESLNSELTDSLRNAVSAFLDPDSDSIGHVLPMAGRHREYSRTTQDGRYVTAGVSSVQKFAEGLVKGASLLGVNRMTDLLAGWTRGEPIKYRTSMVVGLRKV